MSEKNYRIDALFVLLLYGMFALLSLFVLLIGSRIYKNIILESDARSTLRSSLSYVAGKIRAGEEEDNIRLEERGGISVLVIQESNYETLIYHYDGALRELLQFPGDPFYPAYGQSVADVPGLLMAEEGGLFTITSVDADGTENTMLVARRIQNGAFSS